MFTGLIEEVGNVVTVRATDRGTQLQIAASRLAKKTRSSDSIAVNGCCLTLTSRRDNRLTFDLLEETIVRTNLKTLRQKDSVNLERALAASERFGGHFIQGHIDCVSPIIAYQKSGADFRLEIELPEAFAHYVACKGSIAVNGISLTVAEILPKSFVAWIIPYTKTHTNLDRAKAGDPMNLEFDIRMREPPDFFELRLDRLVRPPSRGSGAAGVMDRLESKISRLRAPLIVTARHPMEVGANRLSALQRHNLLTPFLSRARYIDVELRSAPAFRSLLRLARKQNVRCIVSVHYLKSTPSRNQLRDKARAAKTYGADIFKVATRTDTPAQLTRLIDFAAAKDVDIAVSAMGMGKLGAASRVLLVCCGSALVYVSLGRSNIEGQISLEQLRAFGMAPPR